MSSISQDYSEQQNGEAIRMTVDVRNSTYRVTLSHAHSRKSCILQWRLVNMNIPRKDVTIGDQVIKAYLFRWNILASSLKC